MKRKQDRDITALGIILRGCRESSPKMVGANIRFALDKYVTYSGKEKCCDNGLFGSVHECRKGEAK